MWMTVPNSTVCQMPATRRRLSQNLDANSASQHHSQLHSIVYYLHSGGLCTHCSRLKLDKLGREAVNFPFGITWTRRPARSTFEQLGHHESIIGQVREYVSNLPLSRVYFSIVASIRFTVSFVLNVESQSFGDRGH